MIGFRKKRTKESEIQEQSSEKQEEAVSAQGSGRCHGLRLDVISPVPRVPVDAAALWVRLVQRVRLVRLVQQVRRVQEERTGATGPTARRVREERQEQLLRQYMHNTEIAVTMRLSTILKTIKQPL